MKMSREHIEECVDLYIDVFTKAPWNDTYESRGQVSRFFETIWQTIILSVMY